MHCAAARFSSGRHDDLRRVDMLDAFVCCWCSCSHTRASWPNAYGAEFSHAARLLESGGAAAGGCDWGCGRGCDWFLSAVSGACRLEGQMAGTGRAVTQRRVADSCVSCGCISDVMRTGWEQGGVLAGFCCAAAAPPVCPSFFSQLVAARLHFVSTEARLRSRHV